MSFSTFIKNLQSKPKPVRIMILWVSVACTMFIVFGFWLFSINARIQSQPKTEVASQNDAGNQIQEMKKEIPTVWQTLKAGMAGVLESVMKKDEGESNNAAEDQDMESEATVQFEGGQPLQDPYYDALP